MYGIEYNPDLAVPDDSFIASNHRPSGNVFFPLHGLCSWASGTCLCVDGGTRSLDPFVSAFLVFCFFCFMVCQSLILVSNQQWAMMLANVFFGIEWWVELVLGQFRP